MPVSRSRKAHEVPRSVAGTILAKRLSLTSHTARTATGTVIGMRLKGRDNAGTTRVRRVGERVKGGSYGIHNGSGTVCLSATGRGSVGCLTERLLGATAVLRWSRACSCADVGTDGRVCGSG